MATVKELRKAINGGSALAYAWVPRLYQVEGTWFDVPIRLHKGSLNVALDNLPPDAEVGEFTVDEPDEGTAGPLEPAPCDAQRPKGQAVSGPMGSRGGTRASRAAELHRTLIQGPSWSGLGDEPTAVQKERFMVWLNSWITPNVVDLIPELKKKRDANASR
jgi:hypothetical protein